MAGEEDPSRSAPGLPAGALPTTATAGPTVRPSTVRSPDVIVDFELDGDLLHVVVRNIGTGPAHRVRCDFDPAFTGLGGVSVPGLALFRRLEFLPPGGALRAFVDSIASYLASKQPEGIIVTVTFRDDGGRAYRRRIRHDLGIYRDLPRAHRRGG
jgi:hypothetical protein